jgi:shikimate dehydrogenase|tara:strand:- start:8121 stop:8942 length:822 start_codon:yes stop_codon:yes gene_type:complete
MNRPYAEVIGDPIAHSKSPLMHQFWLRQLGIDADYRATHVPTADLPAYFTDRRRDPAWRGCNVTVPHKSAVLEYIDGSTGDVGAIGAANTLAKSQSDTDGGITGHNTDAEGFMRPLQHVDLTGKNVGVIGAGGAARAVLYALGKCRPAGITVYNRTPERAKRIIDDLGIDARTATLEALCPDVDLLVNTSTLGMAGAPPLGIDLSSMPRDGIVYDIVYAPLETALLAQARERGLRAIDGLGMLIGQAMAAFRIFFHSEPPSGKEDELRALLTS